ncbi:type II toxin-antitoxin system VapC family toxin [bacterium]|nr:type II toxin-antitoxin system VapC family toxin [bacterium]
MERYFLDTNILMYAAGKDSLYKVPCSEILRKTDDLSSIYFINTETIQEILYRYTFLNLRDFACTFALDVINLFENILLIDVEDVSLSVSLLKKYNFLMSRDALIAANMINNNIRNIISADKVFGMIEEVRKIDPLE